MWFSRWNVYALCMTHNVRLLIAYALLYKRIQPKQLASIQTIALTTVFLHSMGVRNDSTFVIRLLWSISLDLKWTWIGLWKHVYDISSRQYHSVSNHWTKFFDQTSACGMDRWKIKCQKKVDKMLIFFRKSLALENIIRNWQVASDINGPLRSRKVFFTHRLIRSHDYIITFTDLISRFHRIRNELTSLKSEFMV